MAGYSTSVFLVVQKIETLVVEARWFRGIVLWIVGGVNNTFTRGALSKNTNHLNDLPMFSKISW